MFNFDEEPEKPKLEELPEEEEPEPDNSRANRYAIKVSTDIFGTSLPISIQRRTDNPPPGKNAASMKDKEVVRCYAFIIFTYDTVAFREVGWQRFTR
jgi:hypothetical protein